MYAKSLWYCMTTLPIRQMSTVLMGIQYPRWPCWEFECTVFSSLYEWRMFCGYSISFGNQTHASTKWRPPYPAAPSHHHDGGYKGNDEDRAEL